jgi:broad specificity phosphatase PhoE
MSKIYLIRHGQASFLSDDYDNLSEKGIQQSKALGSHFFENDIHFDKIFIGNLKRHQQTFNGFSLAYSEKKIALPEPTYLQELNEHQVPEALGIAYDDFVNKNKNAKMLFEAIVENPALKRKNSIKMFGLFLKEYTSGRYAFEHPSIQSWADFRLQTKIGIARILEETKKGETVGVFTSGGTKSSIIGDSLNITEEEIGTLNLAIRNTSFSQLLFSKNTLNVFSINEVSHLPKELITFV